MKPWSLSYAATLNYVIVRSLPSTLQWFMMKECQVHNKITALGFPAKYYLNTLLLSLSNLRGNCAISILCPPVSAVGLCFPQQHMVPPFCLFRKYRFLSLVWVVFVPIYANTTNQLHDTTHTNVTLIRVLDSHCGCYAIRHINTLILLENTSTLHALKKKQDGTVARVISPCHKKAWSTSFALHCRGTCLLYAYSMSKASIICSCFFYTFFL